MTLLAQDSAREARRRLAVMAADGRLSIDGKTGPEGALAALRLGDTEARQMALSATVACERALTEAERNRRIIW